MNHKLGVLVVCILLLPNLAKAAGQWQKSLQLGFSQEQNNGTDKSTQRLGARFSYDQMLSYRSLLTWNAELRFENIDTLANKTVLYGDATYSIVPKPGFFSWMYLVTLGLEHESFSDNSAATDSVYLTAAARRRLDDSTQLISGVKFQQLDSSFELSSQLLFASLDWTLDPRWTVYSTLSLGNDTISSSTSSGTNASGSRAARALAGGHLPNEVNSHNSTMNPTVASVTSPTHQDVGSNKIALGAVYLLDPHSSFDFSLDWFKYSKSSNIKGTRVGLDYFYRF